MNDLLGVILPFLLGNNSPMQGQSGIFGQSDRSVSMFGNPSAPNPAHRTAQMAGLFDGASSGFAGKHAQLEDMGSLLRPLGVQPEITEALLTSFPGLRALTGGTSRDLQYGTAEILGRAVPGFGTTSRGTELQGADLEQFHEMLGDRFFDDGRINANKLRGITSLSDMGDVLTYVGASGQISASAEFDAAGGVTPESLERIGDQLEEAVKGYDEVLSVGRDVFGPGSNVMDILNRIGSTYGSDMTRNSDAAKQKLEELQAVAHEFGASVQGVFSSIENLSAGLQELGYTRAMSGRIAQAATVTAVGGFSAGTADVADFSRMTGVELDMASAERIRDINVGVHAQQVADYNDQRAAARLLIAQNMGVNSTEFAGMSDAEQEQYLRARGHDVSAVVDVYGDLANKLLTGDNQDHMIQRRADQARQLQVEQLSRVVTPIIGDESAERMLGLALSSDRDERSRLQTALHGSKEDITDQFSLQGTDGMSRDAVTALALQQMGVQASSQDAVALRLAHGAALLERSSGAVYDEITPPEFSGAAPSRTRPIGNQIIDVIMGGVMQDKITELAQRIQGGGETSGDTGGNMDRFIDEFLSKLRTMLTDLKGMDLD